MSGFASGLTYEQLKALADANAIEKLSKGSIRKNGRKWQAQVSYRTSDAGASTSANGKPKTKRVFLTHTFTETQVSGRDRTRKTGAGGTDELFAAWRAQVVADARMVAGFLCDPSEPVRTCVERFIRSAEERKNSPIRKSTAMNYRYALKRIAAFQLANEPLLELTTRQVQSMVDELGERLARKTVKQTLDLLSQACRATLGTGRANPCEGVFLPDGVESKRAKSGTPNSLTVTGILKFNHVLDSLEANPEATEDERVMALAARLCLQTGMRSEEVAALRFNDIDFHDDGRVSFFISHAIERYEDVVTDADGTQLRDTITGSVKTVYREADTLTQYSHTKHHTKTKSSRRVLSASKENSARIAERYEALKAQISVLYPDGTGAPDIADVYLLGTADGKFVSPRLLCHRWLNFAERHGLIGTSGVAVGLHDLRHSCATMHARSGMDRRDLKRLMGHSSYSLTDAYYVTPNDAEVNARMFSSDSLFGARPNENTVAFNPTDRLATGTIG